ncbi:MAG: metallophosphoesterase [Patescibacteria group bacterium]|nr:metallophosphoesterase [Patescibacteria group bacterium]
MSRTTLAIAAGITTVALAIVIIVLVPAPVRQFPAFSPALVSSPAPVRAVTPTPTLRFVNFGDWGNKASIDRETFRQLERTHDTLGFSDIVTNGDNNYGSADTFPAFVQTEFGRLLADGVKLHFSLGNHDVETAKKWQQEVNTPAWGEWDCRECLRPRPASSGNRYYSFYRAPVRFLMLDSNLMLAGDTDQYGWAVQELMASNAAGEPWQVLAFHHPPFSSAQTHGGVQKIVDQYKSVLTTLGVDAVLNGHDHIYERTKTTPECGDGVQYIVIGAPDLRPGDVKTPGPCSAFIWDKSQAFLYVVATPEKFSAQVITKDGTVVDTWELKR